MAGVRGRRVHARTARWGPRRWTPATPGSGNPAAPTRPSERRRPSTRTRWCSSRARARGPTSPPSVRRCSMSQRRLAKVPATQDFEGPYKRGNARADLQGRALGADPVPDRRRRRPGPGPRGTGARRRKGCERRAPRTSSSASSATPARRSSSRRRSARTSSKALVTSLPITLLILLIAFGAVVAAGVPLLLAITAVIATIGLIGPLSHLIGGVDSSINEVILLIGLAVGVDYSMFYLRREREERESGRSESAALAAAAATSGRAVMISGFTVIIAMAGMYLAGTPTFESFATGTILVVAVAMVGSLTVLPALLAWLGDRVEKGGVPIISRHAVERQGERRLVAGRQPGPAPPRHLGRAGRGTARGPLDPGLQPPHGGPEHRDSASGPRSDPDLQQDPGRLPRRPDPGRGRRQRGRRRGTAGPTRAGRAASGGAAAAGALRAADHDRRERQAHRRAGQTSRLRETAATRSPTRPWRSCATSSSRPRSGPSPASRRT